MQNPMQPTAHSEVLARDWLPPVVLGRAPEVADRVRAALGEPFPRVLAIRTPFLRGPHGIATALVQRLDDGFDGRGFPVPEILAGLLRRLRREARPTVVLLDDVGVGGPDLAPVV